MLDLTALQDMSLEDIEVLIANAAIERHKKEKAREVEEIPAKIEALAEEYTRVTGKPLPPVEAAQRGSDNGKNTETPTP
jgi:hypothetical protein